MKNLTKKLTKKQEKEAFEAGFVLLPKNVITISMYDGYKFTFAHKTLYSYLLHWSHTHDQVYPSLKLMCIDLGISSRTTIIKYLHELKQLGLLKVEKRKGKSSIYIVQPIDERLVKRTIESVLVKGTNQDKNRKVKNDNKITKDDSKVETLPVINENVDAVSIAFGEHNE